MQDFLRLILPLPQTDVSPKNPSQVICMCTKQEAERPVYSNTLLAPPACAALAALADSLEYLAEQLRQVGILCLRVEMLVWMRTLSGDSE